MEANSWMTRIIYFQKFDHEKRVGRVIFDPIWNPALGCWESGSKPSAADMRVSDKIEADYEVTDD